MGLGRDKDSPTSLNRLHPYKTVVPSHTKAHHPEKLRDWNHLFKRFKQCDVSACSRSYVDGGATLALNFPADELPPKLRLDPSTLSRELRPPALPDDAWPNDALESDLDANADEETAVAPCAGGPPAALAAALARRWSAAAAISLAFSCTYNSTDRGKCCGDVPRYRGEELRTEPLAEGGRPDDEARPDTGEAPPLVHSTGPLADAGLLHGSPPRPAAVPVAFHTAEAAAPFSEDELVDHRGEFAQVPPRC